MGVVNNIMRKNALRNSTIIGFRWNHFLFVGKTHHFSESDDAFTVHVEVIKGPENDDPLPFIGIQIDDERLIQMGDKLFFWNT